MAVIIHEHAQALETDAGLSVDLSASPSTDFSIHDTQVTVSLSMPLRDQHVLLSMRGGAWGPEPTLWASLQRQDAPHPLKPWTRIWASEDSGE